MISVFWNTSKHKDSCISPRTTLPSLPCESALACISLERSVEGREDRSRGRIQQSVNCPGKLCIAFFPLHFLTMHLTRSSSSFYKSKISKSVPAILAKQESTRSMSQTQYLRARYFFSFFVTFNFIFFLSGFIQTMQE